MATRIQSVVFAASLAALGVAHAQELTPPPAAELAPGQTASDLLPALIEHSRHTATLRDGALSGEGADFLRALGADSHYVLIGEDHGSAGVAAFASAYWRDLNALGYQYAALEVDPYVAAALERELRAGGVQAWAAFLADHGGAVGAPFVNWAEEAALADAIVRTSSAQGRPAIWGLDQTFIGAAAWQLRDIAEGAQSADARALAERLARSADEGGLSGFAKLDAEALQELRRSLSDRRDVRWAALVDAMIVSHRIYQPFTGGGGESYLANRERETLMKRLFLEQFEAALSADSAPPRVMLKFGAYHTYRGATPTWVQGLGGFVTEFATGRSESAAAIMVLCGPGGRLAQLFGPPAECDAPLAETYPMLTPYIDSDEVTVFDLRVWRLRPGRWAHLNADLRAMIGSFDALVFVPNGEASSFLPGLPPLPAPPQ